MSEKNLGEMNQETQSFAVQQIIRAGDIIQSSFYEREERLIKLLLFLSSGSVVTVLTYMYHLNTSDKLSFISTVFFLLALACSFVLVIRDYYFWRKQCSNFSDDATSFQANKITWDKIRHFSGGKGKNITSCICRWGAIVSITLATLFALYAYVNNFDDNQKNFISEENGVKLIIENKL